MTKPTYPIKNSRHALRTGNVVLTVARDIGCRSSRNLAMSIRRHLNADRSATVKMYPPKTSSPSSSLNPPNFLTSLACPEKVTTVLGPQEDQLQQQQYEQQNREVSEKALTFCDDDQDDDNDIDMWLERESRKIKSAFEEKWNFSLSDDAPMNGLWKWTL